MKGLSQGVLMLRRLVLGRGDADDVVLERSGAGIMSGQRVFINVRLSGTEPATAANYGVFFIADRAYRIVSIREVHSTLGTDAGAVTLTIEKLTGTQALDAGVTTQTGSFNLKGTVNSVQTATLSATAADILLAAGDRLALDDAGVLTAVAGLCVTLELQAV